MRFKVLDGSKIAIYMLFLNWYVVSVFRGALISGISTILYGIAVLCFLRDLMITQGGRLQFSREEWYWLIYGLLSLLTVVFAQSQSQAISGLVDYAKRFFLIVCTVYICKQERSIKFPIHLLTIVALGCAIGSLSHVQDITRRLSLTTGVSISINDVGSIMAFGVFAVGLFWHNTNVRAPIEIGTKITAYIVLISTIFISGSRKAFIAIVIYLVLFILLGAGRISSSFDRRRTIISVAAISIAAIVVIRYLFPMMDETSLYDRLFGDRAEGALSSDESRWELYVLAFKDFLKYPVFGLGYNNYDYVHGNYSHSTYAEPLACSGILSLFYLMPYLFIFMKQIKLLKRWQKYDNRASSIQKGFFAFYIAFIFIGAGIPFLYKDVPCIVLAMLVAWQGLCFEEIHEGKIII